MSVPSNPKLWQMLVLQAKAKFPKYPSLPASKWIHQEHVKKGGQFVTEAQAHVKEHVSKQMRSAEKKKKEKSDK